MKVEQEAALNATRIAVEFGFRAAEKGWNLERTLQEIEKLIVANVPAETRQPPDDTELRLAIESVIERRGRPILEHVKAKDRDLGYQIGMLLGEIARIANVNDPSLPAVQLSVAAEPPPRHDRLDPPLDLEPIKTELNRQDSDYESCGFDCVIHPTIGCAATAIEALIAEVERLWTLVRIEQRHRAEDAANHLDELEQLRAVGPTEKLEAAAIGLQELFDFLKVSNITDAKRSIAGLRERVKFTEDYESLRAVGPRPEVEILIDEMLAIEDRATADDRVPEEIAVEISSFAHRLEALRAVGVPAGEKEKP